MVRVAILWACSAFSQWTFKRTHPNEKLIIGKGKRQIRFEDQIVPRENGTNLILTQEDSYSLRREVSSFFSAEGVSAGVCPQVSLSLPSQNFQSHSQSYWSRSNWTMCWTCCVPNCWTSLGFLMLTRCKISFKPSGFPVCMRGWMLLRR